ncbi:hypothetical protein ACFW08_23190 [Streptomyces sp. NPDC058960]
MAIQRPAEAAGGDALRTGALRALAGPGPTPAATRAGTPLSGWYAV